MAETLQFELVSPERLLLSEQVEMVVVPGTEGTFGVLPRHSALISTLRPGIIDVYKGGAITQQFFVDGGFAEVNATGITVLVDEAVPLAEVSRAKADERRAAAQALVDKAATEEDKRRAAKALLVADEMALAAARAA